MNIIYYTYPEGTKKIAFTISDKKVAQLKEDGVIPKSSVVLVKKKKDMKAEEFAKHVHIDKCVFDNYEKPKAIKFDMVLMKMYYLDLYKQIREIAFAALDNAQLRALAMSRQDLVDAIEADKRALRDLPKNLNLTKVKTAVELSRVYPKELLIDYEEKYRSKLK